jgi:hypothetical protein
MLIKPTVGRVVWYRPGQAGELHTGQPFAAIIAYVHSDTLVNLAIFDHNGRMSEPAQTAIPLYQGEGERPATAYCEWMPYQQGQAAKTESLEKQLKEAEAK